LAKAARSRTTTTRKKNQTDTSASAQAGVKTPSTATDLLDQVSEVAAPVADEAAVTSPAPVSEPAAPAGCGYPAEALYFDANWYLAAYPDVGACGLDAVEHFMTHGYLEGRDPNGHFSVAEYIAANPDIPLTINPFLHFIMHGAAEGRKLHP